MDIDKLTLGYDNIILVISFGSLMDIDKLTPELFPHAVSIKFWFSDGYG